MEFPSRAPEQPSPVPVFTSGVLEPRRRRLVLTAAILASAMGFIDGSITAIALPAMRATLGASLAQAQWFANAYLLVLSALVLIGGAFGDRFGLARVFFAGIALFVAASIVCAAATTPDALIAARALQGLGAAFMVPGSMAIIARVTPPEDRGRALGLWASASAVTTALGPILGGLLLTWGPPDAWRAIFALNIPIGGLALWLIWRAAGFDRGQPGRPVDLTGAALVTVGLGLTSLALTGAEAGFDRPRILTLTAGLAALAAFVACEVRTRHPMMPPALFRSRTFTATNLLTFFLYFALTSVTFFLPMTAISAWGIAPIGVTAAFFPFSVLIGALSPFSGRLADRHGAGPVIASGAALVGIAYAALAVTAQPGLFWVATVPAMTLAGLGMALVVAPLSSAVMAATSDGDGGTASGINNAVARVASLIAVALIGWLAASAYGITGADMPGFGLPGTAPAHVHATSRAFALVAGTAAVTALIAAALAATALRRR
jgi:EmrB/QacA subfamily drug resistance transporter